MNRLLSNIGLPSWPSFFRKSSGETEEQEAKRRFREKYAPQSLTLRGRFRKKWKACFRWSQRAFHDVLRYIWQRSLSRRFYIKACRSLDEAAALRFIEEHTSVPVPHVWFTFPWGGRRHILMDRVPGVSLEDVWEDLSESMKQNVVSQLHDHLVQIRSLSPPNNSPCICSAAGGPVRCFRLHDYDPCGPYRDEDHFNLYLRHLQPLENLPEIVQQTQKKRHAIVFTHNDLFPRNIMVDPTTIKILAIIDWECSGWFPAHWEYCKLRNWGTWRPDQLEWMTDWAPKIMTPFNDEAEADRVLMYESGLPLIPVNHAP